MSTEAANAKRFEKGLTVLTPLEGELLEALEVVRERLPQITDIGVCPDYGVTVQIDTAIAHAHGETE